MKSPLRPPAVPVLLALAALLRVAYLLQNRSNPFFDHPIIDGWEYVSRARDILQDGILWDQVLIHAPLYPTVVAAVFAVSGGSFLVLYLVQHALGLATLWLAHRIAFRAFGGPAATVALALGALAWAPIYYEGQPLCEPLVTFLLAATVLLLLRAGGEGTRAAPRLAMAAGATLGLAVITRANVLVLLLPAAAWLAATAGRRAALGMAIAAVLVIAPVTVQNWRASGSFVPVQANGGFNFYLGNRAGAEAAHSLRPGLEWRRIQREGERAVPEDDAARDAYWFRRGLSFMAESPGRVAGLMAQRLVLFLDDAEVGTSQDPRWHRERFPALRWAPLGAGWATALALLGGVIRSRRRRWSRAGVLLVALVATFLAALLVFPYFSRYRYPTLPLWWALGGAGAVTAWTAARAGDVRVRAGIVVAALACGLFTLPDLAGWRPGTLVRVEYQLGRVAGERGDYAAAIAHYRQALRGDPDDPDVLNNLGLALDLSGRTDEARGVFVTVLGAAPDHVEARMNLAALDRGAGRTDAAILGYERAVRDDPRKFDAVHALATLYLEDGRLAEATDLFRRAVTLRPRDRLAALQLGRLLLQAGRLDEAAAHFERLAERNRTRAIGLTGLARLAAERGDLPAAERLAAGAVDADPEHAEARALLDLIRRHRAGGG